MGEVVTALRQRGWMVEMQTKVRAKTCVRGERVVLVVLVFCVYVEDIQCTRVYSFIRFFASSFLRFFVSSFLRFFVRSLVRSFVRAFVPLQSDCVPAPPVPDSPDQTGDGLLDEAKRVEQLLLHFDRCLAPWLADGGEDPAWGTSTTFLRGAKPDAAVPSRREGGAGGGRGDMPALSTMWSMVSSSTATMEWLYRGLKRFSVRRRSQGRDVVRACVRACGAGGMWAQLE